MGRLPGSASNVSKVSNIEIGLRPGAADLGILGKFAFSVGFVICPRFFDF